MGGKKQKKKRVFAGKNMHLEYHTVNPKKPKASDCIYLSETRECQNKQSPDYLSKCFAASYCTFKLREKDLQKPPAPSAIPPKPPASKKERRIVKIQCSLPLNCKMYSPTFGQGQFTFFDEKNRIIHVTFQDREVRFAYPDAIFAKHLIVPKFAFDIVVKDFSKAEKVWV